MNPMQLMKNVFSFLTQPWLMVLIGIILSSLIIWFIGPLIAIADNVPLASETVRLFLIFLLFIAWGLNNLWSKNNNKKSNQDVANNIVASTLDNANTSSESHSQQDESILSTRLNEAITTLQSSQFGKGDKLYTLPWYMIIGAPGSGKTTALKNSGLQFPLSSKFGDDPIQGAGGTRHCDWWFTNEAILIDTAGRYTTQDNPKKIETTAWLGFLNRLKNTRPKRPLNGIILTISLQDILQKTATQKSMQTSAIKSRIQELNKQLGMELPVYVIFTKTDMIAGFNSFFADLENEELQQTWGFTFSDTKKSKTGEILDTFDSEFTTLMDRINNRVLNRLNHEKNPQRRTLIYEFPKQMNVLKRPLYEFLSNIFVPNQFEAAFALRGVYFISSTQSHSLSQWTTGVLPIEQCAPPVDKVSQDSKTFFVNHIFKRIIFPEAGMATVNSQAQTRFQWIYSGTIAASLLAFVGLISAWGYSKQLNSTYISNISAQLQQYREITKGGLENEHDWLSLAQGLNLLKALPTGYDQADSNPSFSQGLGLYQGDKLGSQAQQTYLKALETFFMKDLGLLLTQQIGRARTDEQLYEALKFYLMLYFPEKMETDSFKVWVNILWERTLSNANPVLSEHLNTHLSNALEQQVASPAIDQNIVAQARETLISTPLDLRLYNRIKNDYMNENPQQYTIRQVLGKKADILFYRRSGKSLAEGIPKLFTYEGFHKGFNIENRKQTKDLTNQQWIYGDSVSEPLSEDQIKEITKRINAYYFAEYNSRWESLFNDLAIHSFSTVNSGQSVVQLLASADKPLVKLLNSMRKNTALSEIPPQSPTEKLGVNNEKVVDKLTQNSKNRLERLVPKAVSLDKITLPGREVSDNFSELNTYITTDDGFPLDNLQKSLNSLSEYIQTLAYANNVNQAAFQASLGSAAGNRAMTGTRRNIAQAPVEIQGWFQSVARDTEKVTSAAIRRHMNDVWQRDIINFFEKTLKPRYPINPSSQLDIKHDDFAAMFGPDGALAKFSGKYITPFVNKNKSRWQWKKNMGIPNKALRIFEKAERIQKAYFNGSREAPQIRFSLKPLVLGKAVSSFLLETGGSSISYQHGPVKTHKMVWPGDNKDLSKIVFTLVSKGTPISARTEGDWSWFRLLDKYATQRIKQYNDSIKVTFVLNGIEAQYELKPQSTYNPFNNNEITDLTLPRKL